MSKPVITDELILNYLAEHQGRWTLLFGTRFYTCTDGVMTEKTIVGPDVTEGRLRAKMRTLVRRGLSGGCDCGCRGDFEITDAGLALIGMQRSAPYSGY